MKWKCREVARKGLTRRGGGGMEWGGMEWDGLECREVARERLARPRGARGGRPSSPPPRRRKRRNRRPTAGMTTGTGRRRHTRGVGACLRETPGSHGPRPDGMAPLASRGALLRFVASSRDGSFGWFRLRSGRCSGDGVFDRKRARVPLTSSRGRHSSRGDVRRITSPFFPSRRTTVHPANQLADIVEPPPVGTSRS